MIVSYGRKTLFGVRTVAVARRFADTYVVGCFLRTVLTGLVVLPSLLAADLSGLRSALQAGLDSTSGRKAVWGAMIVSGDGSVVFATNIHRLFIPASNTKLFTAAFALDHFGPDWRLRTPVYANGALEAGGSLKSDLWIAGQGDPRLGSAPESVNFVDSLAAFAETLHARGLRHLEGDLVLCDAALRTASAGPGWESEDLVEWYGAPVSAFVANDNSFRLTATSAERAGQPALFRTEPQVPSIQVDWRVSTSTNKNHAVAYSREPGRSVLKFTGRLPLGSRPWMPEFSVADAPLYFGELLKEAMERRGIDVSGTVRIVHSTNGMPPGEFAAWVSEPMSAWLARCLKPSQNLHAQLLLAQVGRDAEKTRPAPELSHDRIGLAQMPSFLERAGVPVAEVRLEEGSGLSRGNRVSPAATVALLRHMRSRRDFQTWLAALPVAGVDGTLKNRFRKGPATGKVRAKTGTLRGVNALAGYVTTAAGEELTFAIYVNEATLDPEARVRMDRFVETLAALPSRIAPER